MYKKYQYIISLIIANILVQLCVCNSFAITREQVIKNAEKYANYEWTVKKGNASDKWNKWTIGQQIKGIPYNWCGFDSIDSFKKKIESATIAGNTKKCDRKNQKTWRGDFAGVDCSGFVSRVWELSGKRGTGTLPEISKKISWQELKSGDILNKKGSHVQLFQHFTNDNSPMIYEATTTKGYNRVVNRTISRDNKYIPRRYKKIEDSEISSNIPISTPYSTDSKPVSAGLIPVITRVEPDQLPPLPSGQRQWITVYGKNFNSDSMLEFEISGVKKFPDRVPNEYKNDTELRYKLNVGPSENNWTVKVINDGESSNSYSFKVIKNAMKDSPLDTETEEKLIQDTDDTKPSETESSTEFKPITDTDEPSQPDTVFKPVTDEKESSQLESDSEFTQVPDTDDKKSDEPVQPENDSEFTQIPDTDDAHQELPEPSHIESDSEFTQIPDTDDKKSDEPSQSESDIELTQIPETERKESPAMESNMDENDKKIASVQEISPFDKKDPESVVRKAEYDSAYAWIKTASDTAYLIYSREMKEIPAKQKALEIASNLGKTAFIESLTQQIETKKKNIKDGLENYRSAFKELEKIDKDVVDDVFKSYQNNLLQKGASEQIRVTELAKKHFQQYLEDKQINPEKWKTDLENL